MLIRKSHCFLCSKEKVAQIINYTWERKSDQIVDGVLKYEKDRQRSLEFTQICIVSWMRIAIMASKVGAPGKYDIWTNGLGAGSSVKVSDTGSSFLSYSDQHL
jgi:hypothetical protein